MKKKEVFPSLTAGKFQSKSQCIHTHADQTGFLALQFAPQSIQYPVASIMTAVRYVYKEGSYIYFCLRPVYVL